MRKVFAFAAVALVLPLGVHAGDGDSKKKEVKKEEVKKESDSDRGSGFTHFWVHSVGGTIGNGLKDGARKIGKTF